MTDELFFIENYILFRDDRANRIGGGVAIFANTNYNPKVCITQQFSKPPEIECIWLLLSTKYIICACYIPPNLSSTINDNIRNYFINCTDFIKNSYPNAKVIIAGDFNNLNVIPLTSQLNLVNVVDKPTRNQAILDLILLEEDLLTSYSDCQLFPPISTSDHNVIFIPSNSQDNISPRYTTVYDLRDSVLNNLVRNLNSIDWTPLFRCQEDIHRKTAMFYALIDPHLSNLPGTRIKWSPNDKPWMTPQVKVIIQKRWDSYRRRDYILYEHYKIKAKETIIMAKKTWASRIKDKSPNGLWNLVNSIRKPKHNKPTDHYTAKDLNEIFTKVFHREPDFSELIDSLVPTDGTFVPLLSQEQVEYLLSNCPKKSGGPDKLNSKIIRKTSQSLSGPITHLFNSSIIERQVPYQWKIAKIIPIPKRKNPTINDFRPVSLLPLISKILERYILDKLYSTLCIHFGKEQFGFRKFSSTTCAVVAAYDHIAKSLDHHNTSAVTVLSFDATKAFDTIKHSIIVRRLLDHDIHKNFIIWIADYLSNRQQFVYFNKESSPYSAITSGVPQGAILSPTLFNLYISELKPISDRAIMIKYADDFVLIFIHTNSPFDELILAAEVKNISTWCNANGITLNLTKSERMTCKKSSHFSLDHYKCINTIKSVNIIKFLGIYVNNTGNSFSNHIQMSIKKANRNMYVLRTIKPYLTSKELFTVYKSIIETILLYGSPLYIGSIRWSDNYDIEQSVKRCHNIICGFNCTRNCIGLLSERRNALGLKFFTSILDNDEHILHDIIPHRLPSGRRLNIPSANSNRYLNSFVPHMSIKYNST